MVGYGPITNGIHRIFATSLEQKSGMLFLKSTVKLLLNTSFLVSIISLIVFPILGEIVSLDFGLLTLFSPVLFAILTGSSSAFVGMLNIAEKRSQFVIFQSILPWARIFFAIYFHLRTDGTSIVPFFLGYCIADFIILLLGVIFLKNYLKSISLRELTNENEYLKDNTIFIKQILSYSYPFMIWGVFSWIQASSDRWVISYFSDSSNLGSYIVIWQLGFYPVTLTSNLLNQFYQPYLYKFNNNSNRDNEFEKLRVIFKKFILSAILIFIVLFMLALFFHDIANILVVNKTFDIDTNKIKYLVLASSFIAIGQIMSSIFTVTKRTSRLIAPQIYLPIIYFGILVFCTKIWSVDGVVFGNMAYGLLYMMVLTFVSLKEFNLFKKTSH